MLQRFHVGPRLSEYAIFNKVVYLAGQVPEDASQDIVGQTQNVLAQIDRLLLEAGSDKTRILMCQILFFTVFPVREQETSRGETSSHPEEIAQGEYESALRLLPPYKLVQFVCFEDERMCLHDV